MRRKRLRHRRPMTAGGTKGRLAQLCSERAAAEVGPCKRYTDGTVSFSKFMAFASPDLLRSQESPQTRSCQSASCAPLLVGRRPRCTATFCSQGSRSPPSCLYDHRSRRIRPARVGSSRRFAGCRICRALRKAPEFPFFLRHPWTRRFVLAVGVAMHIRMWLFMEIGLFRAVMLASYGAFLNRDLVTAFAYRIEQWRETRVNRHEAITGVAEPVAFTAAIQERSGRP
jgi:hypothetical protein